MPKKTSRSARALQAQRNSLSSERRTAARPLLDVNSSRLVAEAEETEIDDTESEELDVLEPKTAPVPVAAVTARTVSATGAARSASDSRSSASTNGSNVIRPASGSRRPIARRTTTVVNRAPAISREEEYAFIRTDLLTVLILTILMVIALVVLTFVIGR